MDRAVELKRVISELYEVPLEALTDDFALVHPRFQGSAGKGILAAAIRRRLGMYCPEAFSVENYGQLERAITGAAPSVPSFGGNGHRQLVQPKPITAPVPVTGLHIGVDIEMVENMPETVDFWTADFYRSHFREPEIAYCVRQMQPRVHFAARWCAKEALAKCDGHYVGRDPLTVQVVVGPTGEPFFEGVREGLIEHLPFALSLTHTSLMAAAVVAALSQPTDRA
jgi:phosphopantetheine--protein transferase-like protein